MKFNKAMAARLAPTAPGKSTNKVIGDPKKKKFGSSSKSAASPLVKAFGK